MTVNISTVCHMFCRPGCCLLAIQIRLPINDCRLPVSKARIKSKIRNLRDRVVAAPSPWVTSQDPFRSHPTTFPEPVSLHRLESVIRTARCESAHRRHPPSALLVGPDHEHSDSPAHFSAILSSS